MEVLPPVGSYLHGKKLHAWIYSLIATFTIVCTFPILGDNISLINIIPLRTNRKETFLNLFERTEFNGIITFDYIIGSLFRVYILPVIDIVKPREVLVFDSMLKNSIQKLLESDEAIRLPILLFDDVSQYGESTDYGESGN